MANAGVRLLGVEPRDELRRVHRPTRSGHARRVTEEGLIEAFAHELLTGALDFGDRRCTVMVPRDRVVAVRSASR